MSTKLDVAAIAISTTVAVGASFGWKYEQDKEDRALALEAEARLVRVEDGVIHNSEGIDELKESVARIEGLLMQE